MEILSLLSLLESEFIVTTDHSINVYDYWVVRNCDNKYFHIMAFLCPVRIKRTKKKKRM